MASYDQNGQPQGGSSFKGRLILALIIAFVAWISYMSQVQVNPVTGEKQHVAISPEQEIKLGLESAPEMSREMGGELSPSDPRTIEVKKIGQYLVDHTEAQASLWQFQFHLLADDETVNAFALPGGQIFITLGLLKELQNEAQLAGVLGHEMGHVIERHSAQQMAKSQFGNLLIVAVGAAANSDQSGSSPTAIAAMVNQMIQLRYSRTDESEADFWGVKLLEEVGYNPYAMVEVMEILEKAGGSRGETPEIFQSHPHPEKRAAEIKAYLEKNPPKPGLSSGRKLSDVYGSK